MGDSPNVEIFAAGDGPDASAFQEWANELKVFMLGRSQTAGVTVVPTGHAADGFAITPGAFQRILAKLQARDDGADGQPKQLNAVAVFCHGEAFGVGVGIGLGNVDALAQEIQKHVDVAQPFRMAYFACMTGAANPTLGTPSLGTFGDQRGNGGLAEATCASLIAAGLTKVQVDGHTSYGRGDNNPQLRRFYSVGMYPNFIRGAVGAVQGGAPIAADAAIPPAPDGTRPARPGNATTVEDPRPSLCAYYRPLPTGTVNGQSPPTPSSLKKLVPNIPPKPSVYRTTLDLDAPGAGFTGKMHALYTSGNYWMQAMFFSIQKIWADTYAQLPSATQPAWLMQGPLQGSDLAPSSW